MSFFPRPIKILPIKRSRMPLYFLFTAIFVLLVAGPVQASSPPPISDPATEKSAQAPSAAKEKTPAKPADGINDEYKDDENSDYANDAFKEERVAIADPIQPFNRAMYQFNDKLYFWLLKPAASGYKAVVPEPARIGVRNFFSNLGFPARFISCLFQTDFSGAATELGRFTINTLWGVGGLLDPSSDGEIDLQKQDTDLAQTLAVYGLGHGFYIVWPVLGPSSLRDSVLIGSDVFLYPVSYVNPWYASVGIQSFDIINSTSLKIGEYESLKGAAIDPYIAIRDAYAQYMMKQVKMRKSRTLLFNDSGTGPSDQKETLTGK